MTPATLVIISSILGARALHSTIQQQRDEQRQQAEAEIIDALNARYQEIRMKDTVDAFGGAGSSAHVTRNFIQKNPLLARNMGYGALLPQTHREVPKDINLHITQDPIMGALNAELEALKKEGMEKRALLASMGKALSGTVKHVDNVANSATRVGKWVYKNPKKSLALGAGVGAAGYGLHKGLKLMGEGTKWLGAPQQPHKNWGSGPLIATSTNEYGTPTF